MNELLPKSYDLHAKIRVIPGKLIAVGNTGLRFSEERGGWYQHYTPDNIRRVWQPGLKERVKYSTILAYAYHKFARWWRDDADSQLGVDQKPSVILVQYPPTHFSTFLHRLLPKTIFREAGVGVFSLDVKNLVTQLDQLEMLNNLAIRCEQAGYTMTTSGDE